MAVKKWFFTPIPGISLRVWVKIILKRKVGVKYIPKAIIITLLSIAGVPFRFYERIFFKKKIKETPVVKDPVFILGHWRSGTTWLSNIMSKDPQFGILSIHQAAFPNQSLSSRIFLWLSQLTLPKHRPMDNIEFLAKSGQEEDYALANMSVHSFCFGFMFPQSMIEHYDKYIQFINAKIKMSWKQVYEKNLRLTTLNSGGKQILFKNPPNTGRIKTLLEMYPNAKFIHIYRNPYTVYLSTKNLYLKLIRIMKLQRFSPEQEDKVILYLYKRLMKDYFEQAPNIPKGNLVEIRYEDLEKDTLAVMEHIYESLELPDFQKAAPFIQSYLDTIKTYEKNKYHIDDDTIQKIQNHWKFAIDKLGYTVPN